MWWAHARHCRHAEGGASGHARSAGDGGPSVMIGQATRLARFWEDAEKAYEAVVRFGFATSTYDREGEPMGPAAEPKLSAGDIELCLGRCAATSSRFHRRFPRRRWTACGPIKWRERTLRSTGAGEGADLRVESAGRGRDRARLSVRCSPGTYVRSIAHQLGIALGCGAHVDSLVRTASGPSV